MSRKRSWYDNFTLPGTNYCGPGNSMYRPILSPVDAECRAHDKAYMKMIAEGKNPYKYWSDADQRLYDYSWKLKWGDPAKMAIIAFFGAKKRFAKIVGDGDTLKPNVPERKRIKLPSNVINNSDESKMSGMVEYDMDQGLVYGEKKAMYNNNMLLRGLSPYKSFPGSVFKNEKKIGGRALPWQSHTGEIVYHMAATESRQAWKCIPIMDPSILGNKLYTVRYLQYMLKNLDASAVASMGPTAHWLLNSTGDDMNLSSAKNILDFGRQYSGVLADDNSTRTNIPFVADVSAISNRSEITTSASIRAMAKLFGVVHTKLIVKNNGPDPVRVSIHEVYGSDSFIKSAEWYGNGDSLLGSAPTGIFQDMAEDQFINFSNNDWIQTNDTVPSEVALTATTAGVLTLPEFEINSLSRNGITASRYSIKNCKYMELGPGEYCKLKLPDHHWDRWLAGLQNIITDLMANVFVAGDLDKCVIPGLNYGFLVNIQGEFGWNTSTATTGGYSASQCDIKVTSSYKWSLKADDWQSLPTRGSVINGTGISVVIPFAAG